MSDATLKKSKIAMDMGLNIVATAMPILMLQFVLLPLMATRMDDDAYGLVITLVGVIMIFSQTFCGALNNTRLVLNGEYERNGYAGDFNPLLLVICPLSILLTCGGVWYYDHAVSAPGMLFIALTVLASSLCGYYSVAFRLELNYFKVLINSLVQVAGYAIGYGLFILTGYWELIYLIGYVLSLTHIVCSTRLWKEPYRRTPLMKTAARRLLALALATFLVSLTTYIDRLLLYPLLGGAAVSVYYAATLFGKAVSLATTPICAVVLSYFSKMQDIRRDSVWKLFLTALAVGVLGYAVCILISPFALRLLYPDWAEASLQYIYVTTLTAILVMICGVMNPVIIRFRSAAFPVILGIAELGVYVAVSLPLLKAYGLMGFCWGACITYIVKLIIMLLMSVGKRAPKTLADQP